MNMMVARTARKWSKEAKVELKWRYGHVAEVQQARPMGTERYLTVHQQGQVLLETLRQTSNQGRTFSCKFVVQFVFWSNYYICANDTFIWILCGAILCGMYIFLRI